MTAARAPDAGRRVGIAGATGLIGRALVAELLQPQAGTAVLHAFLRRDPGAALPTDARLQRHAGLDFARLPAELPPLDDLYVALGTTIKVAGSEAAFRAVDHDAVLAIARAARAAGAVRLAVVSALGADAGSRVFYNRVKGEMEAAVAGLGFDAVVIARPSLLAGDRESLGQPARPGERLALMLTRPLAAVLPASIRPIDAAVVARAMRVAMREPPRGVTVMESKRLQALGAA